MAWRKDINPCMDYSEQKVYLAQTKMEILLKEKLGRRVGQIERPMQKVEGLTAKCFRRIIMQKKTTVVYNVIACTMKTCKSLR